MLGSSVRKSVAVLVARMFKKTIKIQIIKKIYKNRRNLQSPRSYIKKRKQARDHATVKRQDALKNTVNVITQENHAMKTADANYAKTVA